MPRFVRVSVNIAQINDAFDYSVPAEIEAAVHPGSLVIVPFGRQTVQGVVLQEIQQPSIPEVKPIESLVDLGPVLTPAQIELAVWMAEQNLTSVAENLDQMLPPGLSQHADTLIRMVPRQESRDALTSLQQHILAVLTKRGDLRGRQLDSAFPKINWRESLPGLVKYGWVTTQPILLPPSVHPRTLRNASLIGSPKEAVARLSENKGRTSQAVMERRQKVLAVLAREGGATDVSMLYAETGANAADLKTLAELELIAIGESEVWRDPLAALSPDLQQPNRLTAGQEEVWKILAPQLTGQAAAQANLLVGVTGSGKTELYLRAVEAVLLQGKQAIVLVPEIALTPQTVRRFHARFPGRVGLIHSRLSPGERYDTWRRIRSGVLPVVVGARSALFAPLPTPGLIVIDECHDESYFQSDFRPHYSAVDTAIAYAKLLKVPLIMGSATPTVEQLYRARREGWQELHLADRILAHQENRSVHDDPGSMPLPPVQVIDMRQELKAGNRTIFSKALTQSLEEVLKNHEQAILFLNRRGSATYVFCRDCGHVMRCPRCDTQLTFHSSENALICHICNYRRKMPTKCPECGGPNIRQFGLGTESLEKYVVEQFPSARVLRWDADTTRLKGAHDLILDHFTQHRADILIGTKMLAKGLDLPLVTLVGVVLADVSLNLPDFHAAERTFQLLSQVAGRAGRSGRGGKAIFQTFHPENYAIQAASLHDFFGFYEQELALRKKTSYPPFSHLIQLEFSHYQEQAAKQAAEKCGEQLAGWIAGTENNSTQLIGPVPCFYSRRNGKYRWQILLRGGQAKEILVQHPLATWQPRGVDVEITVDPPDVL
jgi:primosomal protein N' (replication factor Y) (superfamily II helicase)